MPLEHIIACVDNSAYAINEDVYPSRLGAQTDILSSLIRRVLDDNPESTFGIITIGDNRPTLKCALSKTFYALNTALLAIECNGTIDFVKGLYMADLALKHSQNENGDKHILCFVASPIMSDESSLEKLALQFSKSLYRIDIVSCGEIEQNKKILNSFIETINIGKSSEQLSTLIEVNKNDNFESKLRHSKIFGPEESVPMDDSLDPELLAAIQASQQSYYEQTGISLNSNVITNNTIAPSIETSTPKNENTMTGTTSESAETTNEAKFYSLELDNDTVEFCKEIFEDQNFDPHHISEDIYERGVQIGLFPEVAKK